MLWSDTFVGMGAQVAGAVLCRRVDVRARRQVDIGAVIGDETMVGRGAHVLTDVQVYPYKRIEPAAIVSTSLIWESTGVHALFGDNGIAGLVGVDITPELALKVAQAFGSTLPKGGHVIASRDVSRPSRMVKRAMVAGLQLGGHQHTRPAGGLLGGQPVHDARDEMRRGRPRLRFAERPSVGRDPPLRQDRARHRRRATRRRSSASTSAASSVARSSTRSGDIIYPPRALEYYAAGLAEAMQRQGFGDTWRKVVADLAGGAASIVLPQVARAAGTSTSSG